MNMNKLITIVFAILLLTIGIAQAQHVTGQAYITLTSVDSDSGDYIYIVRNSGGKVDIDTTLTISSDLAVGRLIPPDALVIEPNTGNGMIAGETDSLLIRIYPLIYDWNDGEFARVVDYYRYASFGTTGELTATRTALDWDTGAEYWISLIDDNGTPLFQYAHGVAVEVIQLLAGAAGRGKYTIQPVWKLDNK